MYHKPYAYVFAGYFGADRPEYVKDIIWESVDAALTDYIKTNFGL